MDTLELDFKIIHDNIKTCLIDGLIYQNLKAV